MPDGEQCQPDEMPVTVARASRGLKGNRQSMPAPPISTVLRTRGRLSPSELKAELADFDWLTGSPAGHARNDEPVVQRSTVIGSTLVARRTGASSAIVEPATRMPTAVPIATMSNG